MNWKIVLGLLATQPLVALADSYDECGTYADKDEEDFVPCWYIGGGLSWTHVDPEGEVNGWRTSDDDSSGWQLFIGRQFTPHWFVELNYLDGGEAALNNRNPALNQVIPDAAISYEIPSLMVGYYLFDKPKGVNVYAKAGVASIGTEANDIRIGEEKQTSTQMALGLGADYRFEESPWRLGLVFDSYDRDAFAVTMRLQRFLGGKRSRDTVAPTPLPKAKPTPGPVPIQKPEPVVRDDDMDGVINAHDDCPGTQANVPVNFVGCEIFNGVIEGVNFESNKAVLTPAAKAILDSTIETLLQFPKLEVEIQAHTDSQGAEQYNLNLSEARAESVRAYLISKGVEGTRLSSKGFGESTPIADNATAEGRLKNRRVVFKAR